MADREAEPREVEPRGVKPKYRLEIQRMMYAYGDVIKPRNDTTDLVEMLLKDQMVMIVQKASEIARLRSSQEISLVDILFTIRHDDVKVARVHRFIEWRKIRKNAKTANDDNTNVSPETTYLIEGENARSSNAWTKPMNAWTQSAKRKSRKVAETLILPGDTYQFLDETVTKPRADDLDSVSAEREAYLRRFEEAGERSRNMTNKEYLYWTDCLHVSFRRCHKQTFRDWIGLTSLPEFSVPGEAFDVLGLLAIDALENLVKEALRVKNKYAGTRESTSMASNSSTPFSSRDEEPVGPTPLQVRHIREAYLRLSINPRQAVANLLGNKRCPTKLPPGII